MAEGQRVWWKGGKLDVVCSLSEGGLESSSQSFNTSTKFVSGIMWWGFRILAHAIEYSFAYNKYFFIHDLIMDNRFIGQTYINDT